MGRKKEGQAEKMFRQFGKKVDEFIAELNEAKGNASDEFKSRLQELERSKDSLEQRFKEFRENNKDKWEEVQADLERAAQEFKKAINNLFATRKN